jgi:hypothetical protein
VAEADFEPKMRIKGEMKRVDFAGATHGDICLAARSLFFIFFIPSAP